MPTTFHRLTDLLALATFAYAQVGIARLALEWVSRRCSSGLVWLARLFMILGAAGLLLGFLISVPSIGPLSPFPFRISGVIRGTALLWIFSSTAAYLIYRALRLCGNRLMSQPMQPERRKLLHAAASALIVAPFAAAAYGALVQRTNFRVREIELPIRNLPDDLRGLRLVQISDIHLSPFLSEQEFSRVIDAANELRAHVALVTGDLISMAGDPLDACLRQLSRLRADQGILGCLGNHEIYAGAEDYATEQGRRLGIRFLRDQAMALNFGSSTLNLAGVDYQSIATRPDYLPGAERLILPGAVNVLLSHNPDVFPVAAAKGYDATISGHTHGGQVTVEILHQTLCLARFYTPFVYGLYRSNNASVYVSRGIGTIGIPARIGAPPEISLLRLIDG